MNRFSITAVALGVAFSAASPVLPQTAAELPGGLVPEVAAPVDEQIPVALLVDLTTGQTLFSRDAERRFVPASVTKVMTAYTAFELIDQGKLQVDQRVIIDRELAEQWSGEGSTMFLEAGDRLTIGELLFGITTVSANDASVALGRLATGSDAAWLALMNENARDLGLRDTRFGTPNGWPDEGRTYTSARDLAILAEAMIERHPALYRRYFGKREMIFHDIVQQNHDPVTGLVDGADGIKTGYTRQAGYNFLGSAERDGRRLVMVLAGAPRGRLRDDTARRLLDWGFEAFEGHRILPAGQHVGDAQVQNGSRLSIPLKTKSAVLASLPNGVQSDVSLSYRYRGPLLAPIAEGEAVGVLRVSIPGQQPHDVPLVAAQSVEQANAWERLRNGFMGLFS